MSMYLKSSSSIGFIKSFTTVHLRSSIGHICMNKKMTSSSISNNKKQSSVPSEKKKGAEKFTSKRDAFVSTVPPGELKSFMKPMANDYQPQEVEADWDAWWEKQQLYRPESDFDNAIDAKDNFVMVIPPPNVTGVLHIGHALTLAIEDALVRWNRMRGKNTLWIPGSDHAGIATQVVVEKKLMRERNLTRHDLGREAFIEEVWKWKQNSGNKIYSQFRRLGASVDWSREAFTMDETRVAAVKEAFIRMHRKGIIYRSNRLVNWSCTLRTAISNLEVNYVDLDGPTNMKVPGYTDPIEFGVIHSFAYKVKDSEEEIIVATTRIETMLGDVAVAVHPEDGRYKHLHGKQLVHPFCSQTVTVITDPVLVDMNFGTGAVKVTPAHDPNDFACGQRNALPFINVFTDDGCINENGAQFQGQRRFDARKNLINALNAAGLYRGKAPNKMSIGVCDRSKDVVEPIIRPQWWVNCQGAARRGVQAVKEGSLKIIPEMHEKIWFNWLDNIQDWCISRQLWWGHRIPAYLVHVDGKVVGAEGDNQSWIVANSEEEAKQDAAKRFDVDASRITLTQDPDVLDTWFSSGLFPMSTLGWPQHTADFKNFYPTTLLETGHDILFFWVARMVMQGLELTDALPFSYVFLHAMVRDKLGRKMSKSLGNVIDPLDVVYGITLQELNQKLLEGNLDPAEFERAKEGQRQSFANGIGECGADALRFGLLAHTTSQGRDINLDINRVVAYRQFGNKLWQANRFALSHFAKNPSFRIETLSELQSILCNSKTFGDAWILHRLAITVAKVDNAWKSYLFSEVTQSIYDFWLYDFCDIYLELSKPVMWSDDDAAKNVSLSVLYTCLNTGLRLLHPTMPFLTEELWHRLPGALISTEAIRAAVAVHGRRACGSIMIEKYPQPSDYEHLLNPDVDHGMTLIMEVVKTLRNMRTELGMTLKDRPSVTFVSCNSDLCNLLQAQAHDIETLAALGKARVHSDASEVPSNSFSYAINAELDVYTELVGFDIAALLVKMEKEVARLQQSVTNINNLMKNPNYASKTKDEVKQRTSDQLALDTAELAKTQAFAQRLLNAMGPEQLRSFYTAKLSDRNASSLHVQTKLESVRKNLPADASKITKKSLQMINDLECDSKKLIEEIDQIQAQLSRL